MPVSELPQTGDRFARLAEEFIASRSVVTGLDLDEAANHLKRVSGQREDAVLTGLIHCVVRAIPRQDIATLSVHLDETRDRVEAPDQAQTERGGCPDNPTAEPLQRKGPAEAGPCGRAAERRGDQ